MIWATHYRGQMWRKADEDTDPQGWQRRACVVPTITQGCDCEWWARWRFACPAVATYFPHRANTHDCRAKDAKQV
jgi:hypothetical protein